MKPLSSPVLGLVCWLSVSLMTGCKTTEYTAFAPFDARVESIPNSVAKHLVLLNVNDLELHDYSFSAYLWNEHSDDTFRLGAPAKSYIGSGKQLLPGQSIRFHPQGFKIEDPIQQKVARIEIMGHCREGDFRQRWVSTPSGELKPFMADQQH